MIFRIEGRKPYPTEKVLAKLSSESEKPITSLSQAKQVSKNSQTTPDLLPIGDGVTIKPSPHPRTSSEVIEVFCRR